MRCIELIVSENFTSRGVMETWKTDEKTGEKTDEKMAEHGRAICKDL